MVSKSVDKIAVLRTICLYLPALTNVQLDSGNLLPLTYTRTIKSLRLSMSSKISNLKLFVKLEFL